MIRAYPIILAGGTGTRLWPISRKSYPKQFSSLLEDESLFQQLIRRLSYSKKVAFEQILTITQENFRFIVAQQFKEISITPGNILLEPIGKNTAPAVLAACLHIFESDIDATIVVCPSDHFISDTEKFHNAILKSEKEIEAGNIVTLGIKPNYPETGYGYIESTVDHDNDTNDPKKVKRFIEKPTKKKAKELLLKEGIFWNSGIFLAKAKVLIDSFKKTNPSMYSLVREATRNGAQDLDFLRIHPEKWKLLDNVSLDYAVIEKISNLAVVPLEGKWSDLGDWNSVWQETKVDNDGVSLSENATAIDCKNVLLKSYSENTHIVGVGIENIIGIALSDAVLIADKNNSQEIKKIVPKLREKNVEQSDNFPKDYRPWGWFETLISKENFKVKQIHVYPKSSLSLQSHKYRSEHWVVVSGTALVTIDTRKFELSESQSVYIPTSKKHRLENMTEKPLIIVEVQLGSYLGEDDIIRFEDKYLRL